MFRIFKYMYTNYSLLFSLLVVGSKVDLWRQNLKKTFDRRCIHSQQQKCNLRYFLLLRGISSYYFANWYPFCQQLAGREILIFHLCSQSIIKLFLLCAWLMCYLSISDNVRGDTGFSLFNCYWTRLIMCTNEEDLHKQAQWNGKGSLSRQKLMDRLQCEWTSVL